MPRLPRKVTIDVTKCHTCHTERKWMSPSATPATQSEDRCHQAPRLPHKMKADVTKCHACHANGGGDHGAKREPSASPEPAQCRKCHACHAKCEDRCHQAPRLPRKTKADVTKCHACHANGGGDHGAKREPSASPEPAQCRKCHACHAKSRSMSPSATPATQNEGRCHQVPRLPRKPRRRPRHQTGIKRVTRASPVP